MKQETLVTQYYAQIVGLSEGHRHKAFQIIELSLESCGIEFLKGRVDSRVRGQVIGVQTQMQSFNFFFGIQRYTHIQGRSYK